MVDSSLVPRPLRRMSKDLVHTVCAWVIFQQKLGIHIFVRLFVRTLTSEICLKIIFVRQKTPVASDQFNYHKQAALKEEQ